MASSHTSNGAGSAYRSGDRWRGSLHVPDPRTGQPRRRYVTGRNRKEVEAKLRALAKSGYSSNEKVADYLAAWLLATRQNVRASSWRQAEQISRLYLVPHLGAIRLSRLLPTDVERMTGALIERGLSPRTASHARVVLRRALARAERDGLVTRNAAAQAHPPKIETREMAYLDAGQLRTLLDALAGNAATVNGGNPALADHPLGPLVTLAATTGLRQGELLGLAWDDVELDAGRLSVRRQLGRTYLDHGYGYALGPTKTAKSRRTLHLPERAVEALRRRRVRQAENRLAVGSAWQDRDGLIFTNALGQSLRGPEVNKAFGRMLRDAGLPGMPFHSLRHSAATALLSAGVGLRTVSDQLGHADSALVLRTYGHVVADQREEAARAMDRALA